MAHSKKVKEAILGIKNKAIECHKAYIDTFCAYVPTRYSIEQINTDPKLSWLLKMHERIIKFAEETQLKMIPQEMKNDVRMEVGTKLFMENILDKMKDGSEE